MEEAFLGNKPCVDHLRIFGFLAYIHIPKDKRKKLDSTSLKGIFVAYSLSSKAYRIYIKEGHRIEVSIDVIFNENITYKKSKDIPVESNEEDISLLEEEEKHDKALRNQDEEVPSEPIQPTIIIELKKRPN